MSPSPVVHHYRSKARLHEALDDAVVGVFRSASNRAILERGLFKPD